MTKTNIRIGADPEVFLQNAAGEFISGNDLIPGTKYNPFRVKDGAVQVDGTALEFNINPVQSADNFVGNITSVIATLRLMIKKNHPEYKIVFEPTAYYSPKYFETIPAYAKALGCSPDYDAYSGSEKHPPETKEPFRTGSGHVHIGWVDDSDADCIGKQHFEMCRLMTQNLDASLYVMSHAWDDDRKRRELYGQRGSFRPKEYGVEYRVLSNAWLRDEALMRWVYDTSEAIGELSLYGVDLQDSKEVKEFVNRDDFDAVALRDYQAFLGSYGISNLPEEYIG